MGITRAPRSSSGDLSWHLYITEKRRNKDEASSTRGFHENCEQNKAHINPVVERIPPMNEGISSANAMQVITTGGEKEKRRKEGRAGE
jgi:hypothetical protein